MRTPGKPLDCFIEARRELLVIRPIGELDVSTREEFSAAAAGPATNGHRLVVLDLRELEFCDSSGLSVILNLAQSVPAGTRFVVIPGRKAIQRLFAVSGVEHMLHFVDAADVELWSPDQSPGTR